MRFAPIDTGSIVAPWLVPKRSLLSMNEYSWWSVERSHKYTGELPWKLGMWRLRDESGLLSVLMEIDLPKEGMDRLMLDFQARKVHHTWKTIYEANKDKVQEYVDMYMRGETPSPTEAMMYMDETRFAIAGVYDGYLKALAAFIVGKKLTLWVTFEGDGSCPFLRVGAAMSRRGCAFKGLSQEQKTHPEVLMEFFDEDWARNGLKENYPEYYETVMRDPQHRAHVQNG